MKIAMAQVNTIVGDLGGNARKCIELIKKAEGAGADIVTFPELAITGYPPEDLLLKPGFIQDNLKHLQSVVRNTGRIIAIVGFVDKKGSGIYNAAAVIHKGRVCGIYHKAHLPNYGVFDEKRYFSPGSKLPVFSLNGLDFGVEICEDIWSNNTVAKQAAKGAKMIFVINASPYYYGKIQERELLVTRCAKKSGVMIFYNNLVGGQDELIFDGGSFAADQKGRIIAKGSSFKEDFVVYNTEEKMDIQKKTRSARSARFSPEEEVYSALKLGLNDYALKNGFKKAVIALSGGVDSSLVAAVAADTLGKNNVLCIYMPSQYSSGISEEDAGKLCSNLGVKLITIPIQQALGFYLSLLTNQFSGTKRDTTEENLQARIRGNIIMAVSNKFGYLVLSTGNKSEMSTGYATLYGDMAGGFALIKDVYKTLVYRLAQYRNSLKNDIPRRILTRAPSAELKPDQKDQDTLPPYPLLDRILKRYIEDDMTLEEIAGEGFGKEVCAKVIKMVDGSEYKRRQAPIGPKITPKSFGRDRRMPIVNKYF